jgi:hypothetical protein
MPSPDRADILCEARTKIKANAGSRLQPLDRLRVTMFVDFTILTSKN